jgi:hypothetical protein
MSSKLKLIGVKRTLLDGGANIVVNREQEIPDWFLDQLNDARFDSVNTRAGEMHRVVSLPASIVESWKAEGFDVHEEPITATVARLKRLGLEKFLATSKRI